MAPCLVLQPSCTGISSRGCNQATAGSRLAASCPASCSQRVVFRQGAQRPSRRHALVAQAATAEATRLDVTQMAPLGDRVLVKHEEEKNVTSGGVLLTSGATKAIQEALIGEVLAVGEDVDIEVKQGDRVVFSKYGSTDVNVEDGQISFVAQKSIMATLS
ncbi:hypothetical protein WJX72_002096 [[Myrmecia] bisecta]|uniref:Uncharacterized protein n=1 Tax=[Myrmecia] bisecta TaxID=41462 RepID=A0AAW1Q9M1_9CHLO